MGWKSKNKSKKNKKADEKRPEKPPRAHKEHYDDIIKENADFEKYYKKQGIISDEEWPEFLAAFQRPLPTTFRLTGYRTQAEAVLRIIQGSYFQDLMKLEGEEEEKVVPINLPWYPNNFGWQLNLSRKDIRKNEALFRLHNFLVAETATGNISRQEAVSMIPPLVLDVKPHHKVLDMCAAPGSKTAQLIEMLHMDEENVIPSGLVVANDADNKRCYMLVHQTKRLQSPCFVIVNHDATVLPTIQVSTEDGKTVPLKFDRILCDVPCSGDGTLRKNLDVWMKFNTANGNNLHGIQYRIAKRAIELLEVGGQMVYSTCSLNPIEDEAVIARIIKWGKGSLELADASERLQGLVFRRGISHWTPMNRELQEFTKFEDVPEKDSTLIRPHVFPPTPEEAESLHLDRCIRVLPHLQDTGGFFIALVKKIAPLPWEKDTSDPWKAVQEPGKEPPNKKRRRVWGFKEDPFVYFRDDEPVWPEIRDFYGLEDLDPKNLFSRTHEEKKKNIYVSSPAIRSILTTNGDKVKIINTGVKILIRCDNKGTDCGYRLAQEGAHVTALLMKKRRVKMEKEDLIRLLMIDEGEPPAELQGLRDSTKQSLTALSTGSVMLEYHHDEPAFTIHLAAWKGNSSLRAYVSRQERIHYLTMVGADVSKFETNKFLMKTPGESPEDKSVVDDEDGSQVIEEQEADSEVADKEEVDSEVKVESNQEDQ